ncbi:Putative electron transport protein YccM [Ruegeria sp. THAF57]|uniref:4Fe-4S binding protein n=1 Tax=Ruegeria sp. THAF57 TaxID=2744555 RepID=UPI0015DE7E86|nr:4Fe-4S binding protein [Ruegeria sp. THAF57]CAD0187007.1 Putative electron transport protein YccM [Ruegeria sp. THAF57]
MRKLVAIVILLFGSLMAAAEPLPREKLEDFIRAPFSLGDALNDKGVYALLNSGGIEAGFVFETEPLAPLPGFSGAPINMLVVLDLEGRFMDVQLIEHNEPIFVSGLGQAPFHKFFEQYGGHSISDSIVVGTQYGDAASGSQLVYLDGVTKATASVRIAHESVMGAALAVAREKMQGLATSPPAFPNPDHDENLTWDDLIATGIATHKTLSNSEVEALFAGTLWEDDDPEAQDYPDEPYLDLWIVDLGPKSIARAALSTGSFEELQGFMEISDNDEPILLIETARHGLVSDEFVRNTAPDWISAEQDGLPVALRDADLLVELADGAPDGTAMILRTDRRLGFDPSRDWILKVLAVREHGIFQPETGSVTLEISHTTPDRFFSRPVQIKPAPPWLEALRSRQSDMIILSVFLVGLVSTLGFRMNSFAAQPMFTPYRLGILAVVVGFVGWWGQGQLSIVTVLGSLRAALEGGSFAFLLYDPFSLLIWAVSIVGLGAWGRGLFCGWLCPFGALQEFAHHVGRALRIPQIEPSDKWDQRLKWLKYVVLAALVVVVFTIPDQIDKAAEVEPFKTAITTFFVREWYYVAYAAFWLFLGMVMFKGFCRYVCPLGAFLAIGGLIRGRDWIDRRADCGSPCQLCRVKCKYGAIKKTGEIQYDECFQCLDCVAIHDDRQRCVPLIIAARRQERKVAAK